MFYTLLTKSGEFIMIFGSVNDFEQEYFAPLMNKAVKHLKETDWSQFEAGSYEIDGDNMFASVQELTTVDREEKDAESHAQYIDVQYLISGEEAIYVARPSNEHVISEHKLDSEDVILYSEVQNESKLNLSAGMFAIFFPNDIHTPGCINNEKMDIKKVVIKVKVLN
jgi:biofilm protein TabA